jgi:hypothetical protein
MPHDDNHSSEGTPPLGAESSALGSDVPQETEAGLPQESAANRGHARESGGATTTEGQAGPKSTSPMEGLLAWRVPSSDNKPGPVTPDFRPIHDALWEQYQPVDHIEVLLLEKISADLKRYNVLSFVETTSLLEKSRVDLDWLQRAERIFRIQAALWQQLVQGIRELERVQQQRKAGAAGREARPATGKNTVNEPDWTVVMPIVNTAAGDAESRLAL